MNSVRIRTFFLLSDFRYHLINTFQPKVKRCSASMVGKMDRMRFSLASCSRLSTILVKILGTRHKIALLQSLIQCPPLPPFQCWLNQTPFDHPNIELGGKGDEKVLNVCFHLDILGIMTKTQKFASVPIYFDQDCLKMVVNK